MLRLGFIINHPAALFRDWASLYIILSCYAETGLHYISFSRSMQKGASLYIILYLYAETGVLIIYHSVALCRDWASLYIILPLYWAS